MPEAPTPGDRSPAQRETDHASLARLSETLVPALVQKLNTSGLGELEIREGNWRVRLRRPAGGGASAAPAAGRRAERPRLATHALDRDAHTPREAPEPDGRPQAADERRAVATSPAVGIFTTAATPGSRVRAGDRIGAVDLLGIPQDVVAPVDGTLVEILVASGDAVEYGEMVAAVEADPRPPAEPPGADGEG